MNNLITLKEVAKLLQINYVTAWRWKKQGLINPYMVGNKKLYKKTEIEKMLNV